MQIVSFLQCENARVNIPDVYKVKRNKMKKKKARFGVCDQESKTRNALARLHATNPSVSIFVHPVLLEHTWVIAVISFFLFCTHAYNTVPYRKCRGVYAICSTEIFACAFLCQQNFNMSLPIFTRVNCTFVSSIKYIRIKYQDTKYYINIY